MYFLMFDQRYFIKVSLGTLITAIRFDTRWPDGQIDQNSSHIIHRQNISLLCVFSGVESEFLTQQNCSHIDHSYKVSLLCVFSGALSVLQIGQNSSHIDHSYKVSLLCVFSGAVIRLLS
jgi:hypothetical protein